MNKSIMKLMLPAIMLSLGLASCSLTHSQVSTNYGTYSSYAVDSSGSETNGSADSSSLVTSVSVSSTPIADSSYTNSEAEGEIPLKDGASTTTVSSGVTIDNSANLIAITSAGVYVITGTLSNGSIYIATPADDESDVELDLNGASITKSASTNNFAPIYSASDAHLKIKRVAGTTSVVVDKRTADSGDDSAAIFSNKKVKVVGSGSLSVTATYNNGIASDSHVEVKNGALSITATNHCIKAHKSVILGDATDAGSITLTSTGADGGGVRVDEIDATVTNPVYGPDETEDDINGIEVKVCSLNITAVGKGLSSEAYLYMEGGNGTISSTKDKGIKAESDLYVDGGVFTVKTPSDDCLHSSSGNVICGGGTYTLSSGTTDGCQGIKGSNYVYLNGGYFAVTSSYEGIAAHQIVANGGTSIVTSSDDGWSAGGTNEQDSSACSITVNSGYHYVKAGGDGIDSNGNLTFNGGVTVVSQSSNGNGPLDYGESAGTFTQNGGITLAYGSSSMATGASAGTQNSVLSSHSTVSSGNYYIFTVGSDYYAMKLTNSSTDIYASFPGYGSTSYNIYSASSATLGDAVFEGGDLYNTSTSTGTSLVSGTFSAAKSTHVSSGSSSGGGGGPGGGGGGPGGGR